MKFNNMNVRDELRRNRQGLYRFPRIFDRAIRSDSTTTTIHRPMDDTVGNQLVSYHLPRARSQNNVTLPSLDGLTNYQTRLVGFYNGGYVRVPARECTAGAYRTGAWSENQDRLYGRANNPQAAGNIIGIPHTRLAGVIDDDEPSVIAEYINDADILRDELALRERDWRSLVRNERDTPHWYIRVRKCAKDLAASSRKIEKAIKEAMDVLRVYDRRFDDLEPNARLYESFRRDKDDPDGDGCGNREGRLAPGATHTGAASRRVVHQCIQ